MSVAPICSPSAKKVTLTIFPSVSLAVAETETLLLATITSLADGVVIAAVGPVPTGCTMAIGTEAESNVVVLSLAVARAKTE